MVSNERNFEGEVPATRALTSFIAQARVDQLSVELRTKVREVLVDYCGVAAGALNNVDSTEPIYKAISALQGKGNSGICTVIGHGEPHMLPQYAGLLNSAFGHSLDFDDTYADGTLHAGITTISAAMTQAELLGQEASSDLFMLAVCVGYEVTCRLGRELGLESYNRGFHNTATAGIFGAVAAIAALKRLPVELIDMAFGLAGSKAAGSMQYLDNGSWNKRLHPGFAVHDAFMCISLAEAGVIGATKIIEGKMGFLQAYSPKTDQDLHRLVNGLGTEWVWLNSSLKPFPACRMTHGFIELTGNIHNAAQVKAADVDKIELRMPPVNFLLIGDPTPNKIHPTNHIDAQFSVYFQVANALLYGSTTGIQAYHKLQDQEIKSLCAKIVVKTDPSMDGFAAALKLVWSDGTFEESSMRYPLGEVQHPFIRDKVDEKFMSLAEPVFGGDKAKAIIKLIDHLEEHTVQELFLLLR
ncbi:uncharacterized protein RCC_07801 [Ramularia collo-cygni]|uniref:Immune-responsive protein 1 n=1 Tax=Ramularia collo-cygni TaxID=112498 RepID=A0A2D3VG86_9PEZI|nr:uncharacterized protein RCC_07801 [Ramularia collo-cygni]CZT21934.1 uncharacterized protein RCC_07801 [Ramularia collo-cygni]